MSQNTDKIVNISKVDEQKQIVWGAVYVPYEVDTQGDWMTPEEIEKMAYRFMKNLRLFKIDTHHDEVENGCYVVESFIAREGDPDFEPGSWVVATKITDDDIWQAIMDGEITGYSMQGFGTREPASPPDMEGGETFE